MKRIYLLLCAALLCSSCGNKPPVSTGIIPVPNQVTWGSGTFQMPDKLTYTSDLKAEAQADLRAWIDGSKRSFALTSDPANPALKLTTDPTIKPEGYRLEVTKDSITIAAADPAGIFYGLQSLVQLSEHFEQRIPALIIDDAPRFEYRGLMLDVSRNFRDKAFVKKQLDLLARYKINRFHWHLTDGAGWRIEIKKYPKLTDIAAWRPYSNWNGWNDGGKQYCHRDDPKAQGGYYTQDDIREVVEYARKLHITVIPEIEMPGHSEEVLAVYPELSCTRKPHTDAGSDFCIGNEQTFIFLTDVLAEVIELFPSEYIHIGGDEASKQHWRNCPKCKARMQKEGLKSVDELQSYLIHRIEVFLNSKGRRLLGWDEILEGGLAPNATVMSWRGSEGGIAAAKAGHHAIMTPNNHCYLDYCQDDPTNEPPAAASFVDLAAAYNHDPAPDSLGAAVVPMILGVQGNLWCELIPTDEQAEHMLWPRMLAIAEVGWSLPENKDYNDFYTRVLDAVAWMQVKGYKPFDQKNAIGPRAESLTEVKCLATGKKVVYNPIYSPQYAAAGDTSLTDGLRGGWNYGDHRWHGWLNTDVELTLDLEKSQSVKRISADFMQAYFAWIWMPKEVIVSVSDDGQEFHTLATLHSDLDPDFRQNRYETFAWEGQTQARYIRLKAISNQRPGSWIFTDEIIVE